MLQEALFLKVHNEIRENTGNAILFHTSNQISKYYFVSNSP